MLERLTVREEEVLQAISEGLTNPQIATRLTLAEGTIKSHVRSILKKLRVHDRASAVRIAIELDIIEGSKKMFDFSTLDEEELLLCTSVAAGKSDEAIGKQLGITRRPAQKRISDLCKKVGVKGRYHLAAAYTEWKRTKNKPGAYRTPR